MAEDAGLEADSMRSERTDAAQQWLNERAQPGNWLDIAPGEEIHPDIKGWDRTIVQMQHLTFGPEIRSRKAAGTLSADFMFWGGQLIQPHGGGRIVRLNNEIRGRPYLRTDRSVEKGEEIKLGDFANLEYFDLEDDELDSGHFTMFFTGSGWILSFDFRSGRHKCAALIEKALTFLAATRMSVEKGLAEPAIDSLFTAAELVAKTRLILDHEKADAWTSHKATATRINLMARMGNISGAFRDLFNRLSKDRNPAKYATGYEAVLPSWDDVNVVENMALALQESVKPRRPDDSVGGTDDPGSIPA
jgi:hypothetical protein